jgi:phage tail-like protein
MRIQPAGPTFWRLGGLSGWQSRTAKHDLAVSDAAGLRLAAYAKGPLSLLWKDGSLGGLTLPRGMAFDPSHALCLLASDGASIKRYDGETRSFVVLPEIGGAGNEPRRFSGAKSIAIAGDWLYVVDETNLRVQVFDVDTLVLIDILTRRDWKPIDVVAYGNVAFILDGAHPRVFRHGRDGRLRLELERRDDRPRWSRIAADRKGELYLLDATRGVLERRDEKAGPVTDAGAVRDLFAQPPIRLDERNRFCLPASLGQVCGRRPPSASPEPETPLSRCNTRRRTKPSAAVAAEGAWLFYVVRRKERRVDAYTDGGRRLRHSWGACMEWQPCDVAACGDVAYVLDEQAQAVHRHSAGREQLKVLFRDETAAHHWLRIACDDDGAVYLYQPGKPRVQVFDCTGAPRGERPYREVAALFEAARPAAPAAIEGGLFFDRNGNSLTSVDFSEPSGTRLYETTGTWQSKPLDSGTYRCQWHRVELELSGFPPGSAVAVATCAHESASDVDDPTKAQFFDAYTFIAPIEPSAGKKQTHDMLVPSGPGQFLSLRLTLRGDGFSTPAVGMARVHYPRESYLQYLPATYSVDDEGRIFLERFLSIFQTEWDAVERTIEESERLFDPDAAPDAFLEYLATQWLALPLEAGWTDAQKRRLIAAVPKIYPQRGRLEGLRDFLAVYLANIAGLETDDVRRLGFPAIVEGFRERELFVTSPGRAQLGGTTPLWSASVKRRLQLGVYSREGEAALVSTGEPERDVFAEYSHRFRVCMPAGWVRTEDDERMIRRAIEAEKPAHTQYELCLIEPRFRLDAQSTVGVDTVIGEAPSLRLGCDGCRGDAESLPPRGRLGFDSVLTAQGKGSGSDLRSSLSLRRVEKTKSEALTPAGHTAGSDPHGKGSGSDLRSSLSLRRVEKTKSEALTPAGHTAGSDPHGKSSGSDLRSSLSLRGVEKTKSEALTRRARRRAPAGSDPGGLGTGGLTPAGSALA